MELRSPDPATNPYVSFALLIQAGLNGIEKGAKLQPEGVVTGRLPAHLGEAVALAEVSTVVKQVLPERFASQYLKAKSEEYERMIRSEDARTFELENYFAWV
jgi:glutamine synthetase